MPIYCYKCPHEHRAVEMFLHATQKPKVPKCDACGTRMVRDYRRESGADYGRDYYGENGKGLLSDAMGVSPHQVEEHRRRYPNIPLTDDGRVICRNATERKRIMKELGFVDRDGY